MRTSQKEMTFVEVQKIVSEHFGLPINIIFFSDAEGRIYMKDMNVLKTLFPMITARRAGEIPEIYVKLRNNMSTLDYLDGNQTLKVKDKETQDEHEKVQSAKMRRAEIEEQKRRDLMEKKLMKDKRIRKKKRWSFCKGLLSMCAFLTFTFLLVSSTIEVNNVHETLLMRQSVTQQFFKGEKNLPIYFREFVDVYEYILDYEGHLKDRENIFFRDNTLLPYM